MKKFGSFICKNRIFILITMLVLLIPSLIGMVKTKINYDILVYLPKDIETVKGEKILADDFNMGAFSVSIIDNMPSKDILKLEDKIKKVDGVEKVVTAYDIVGTNIPLEILPVEVKDKVQKGKSTLMLITYNDSTSSESTLNAVDEVKKITDGSCKIGGMSAVVLDTMELSEREITIYIVIAVLLCILVLEVSLDSYVVPFILLANIGVAILFNLGTNIIFGNISYITKALVAVLQLGVTTDFSIFLYHAYERNKEKYKDRDEAMSNAISETFTSVTGSSLTTIAGFLVLCTMNLTLGRDLGLVMAKGVLLGVICVLTIFPVLLLTFDKLISKTKHRSILPKFNKINDFTVKNNKVFLILFLILFVPAYLANSKVDIYYKLDESLPRNLDSIVANEELSDKFNIVSPEIILIDKNIKPNEINNMIAELKNLDGIDFVLSFSELSKMGINEEMLSDEVVSIFESGKYQMIFVNSIYEIASNELNEQVEKANNIIKNYDKNAILAGEGPLMKDLVDISNKDFNNVNYSSIICILIIMLVVLKSFSLPILLILAIEFAIFANLAISYFNGVTLPFVAQIVLGTIQLGATIDYAILMTTTYLSNRKSGLETSAAMKETLYACTSSILVSGLCFFAATFGVGIYSKLEMISSLCTLISRGALISMIVVILILPSILITFDKIICKTTFGFKKERGNMKKITKSVCLLLALAILPINTQALTKEETVYTTINTDGSIKEVFVNEHLINNKKLNEITDLSNLTDIINTNGNEQYKLDSYHLLWEASGSDIFYRGKTTKKIPVSLNIKYYLNDKESNLDDIIGQAGKVIIKIKYTNNDKHSVKVNEKYETMYTPFIVTLGTMIDGKNNSNVSINNGKVVNNGSKYIVVGMALPGLYESLDINSLKGSAEIKISFNTTKFELPSMYSIITPKLIESKDLKVFDELDTLYTGMDTLKESITKLEEGANKLLDASKEIDSGASLISSNLKTVSEKLSDIESGAITIDSGLKEILNNLENSKKLLNNDENTKKLKDIKDLIAKNTLARNALYKEDAKVAYETYHLELVTNEQIMAFDKDTYASLGLVLPSEEAANEMNQKLIQSKTSYELVLLLDGNNKALTECLKTFENTSNQINTLITSLEGYLTQIEDGANKLSSGTAQIKFGVSTLADKTNDLSNGTNALYKGINELTTGLNMFDNQGITKLANASEEIKTLEAKVKAIVKLGEEYETFDTKSSSTKGSTKFILTSESVKVKEIKQESKQEKVKENLWTRIKNLFR